MIIDQKVTPDGHYKVAIYETSDDANSFPDNIRCFDAKGNLVWTMLPAETRDFATSLVDIDNHVVKVYTWSGWVYTLALQDGSIVENIFTK